MKLSKSFKTFFSRTTNRNATIFYVHYHCDMMHERTKAQCVYELSPRVQSLTVKWLGFFLRTPLMVMQETMACFIILLLRLKLVQMKTPWAMGSEPFGVKNFPKAAIEKKIKTVFSGIRNVFDMTFMCEIEIYHCPNYRPTMRELPTT